MRAPISSSDVGVYVHYPYCEKKCPYCDFNVHAIAHDDRLYTDAVLRELDARAEAFGTKFATLYFGGGTPSEWDPAQLSRVIDRLRPVLSPHAEITLEANPGTVAETRIETFARAGVNRFSIGAQSFHDHELEILGRTHSAREITTTVQAAQRAGARVSIDLIYALPGQTAMDLHRSIARAYELGVDHISAYTLTIEPTTPLARKVDAGSFEPMPDDEQAELIQEVTDRLETHRYFRYEVSSYSPPGLEAVHNSIYWIGGAYLGVGAGAHSYLPAADRSSAVRREGLRSPGEYIEDALAGRFTPRFEEHLDRKTVLGERLMVGVRSKWGVDLEELGLTPEQVPALAQLVKDGLLEQNQELSPTTLTSRPSLRFRPTAKGFFFADLMGRKLLTSIEP